jgi:hypothetical protein
MKPPKSKRPSKAKALLAHSPGRASESIEIDYDRLRNVSKVVQLNDVLLVEGGFVSLLDPRQLDTTQPTAAPEYQLSLVDGQWWRDGQRFDVGLGYRVFAAISSEKGTIPLFEIRARWFVSYSLPDSFEPPAEVDESFADFVAANGQVNAFPYLRQLVSDLSGRAGWPPLVLAVLRAPAKRPRGLIRKARPWQTSSEA